MADVNRSDDEPTYSEAQAAEGDRQTREEPKTAPDPAEVPNPSVQGPDLVRSDDPY